MTIAHYASDHAQQRAIERLGFAPTADQWRDAALAILDTIAGQPRALMTRRHEDTETWVVAIAGRTARVIWSPRFAVVVTVLG